MNTTRRTFFALLSAGAVFIWNPLLRVFSKPRTETVHATVHQRITETGGSYRYITTQVRGGFKVGDVVKVTIERT